MEAHRILLVDDDADDQLFFLEAISAIDKTLHCDVASNGIEAIDHLNKMPPAPSLIFLDLNMPKMNGYECLERIRQICGFNKIPVVIFTTSGNPREAERTKSLGADIFLTKTSDFKKLQLRLNEILNTAF
jgi:CheY-like chemotaxis protein